MSAFDPKRTSVANAVRRWTVLSYLTVTGDSLRGGDMSTQPRTIPKTIETLADAVYPSFAMLAGMELDLFTPLKDGPLTAEEIAGAAGTDRDKTVPLLQALVAIGLLKSDGD